MNDDLFSEPKIIHWQTHIDQSGCKTTDITIRDVFRKPSGELLFALLSATVKAPENYPIPPIIFIRGDACIIVPVIKNTDTGEERFLTVTQRRIASGRLSLEFPAGMLDRNVDDPAGTALKELEEETGLIISPSELFPLCSRPLYSSPGASDEAIWYFGCIIDLSDAECLSLEGRLHGNESEHEYISLSLKTASEIEAETTSLQVMLGLSLIKKYTTKSH